jgi:hypothetical protein
MRKLISKNSVNVRTPILGTTVLLDEEATVSGGDIVTEHGKHGGGGRGCVPWAGPDGGSTLRGSRIPTHELTTPELANHGFLTRDLSIFYRDFLTFHRDLSTVYQQPVHPAEQAPKNWISHGTEHRPRRRDHRKQRASYNQRTRTTY